MISNLRIAWLLSYISIASFSAAIITPALPLIQLQFGLKNGEVEWIVSSFLLGYVFGQLLYGPLANRFGRLTALRVGLVINLIGVILVLLGVLWANFPFIIVGRFINALGAASGLACTYMIINEWLADNQRPMAMAYSILSFTIGIGLAVTIGGLISEYASWSLCFWLLLVHGFVMLYGTRTFVETLVIPQKINFKVILCQYRVALSSTQLIIFSVVIGFCSAMGYCFSAVGPQIGHQILGINAADYGYWNLVNMLGMLLSSFWARKLLRRYTARQTIILGMLGSGVGILSLFLMWYHNSSSSFWFFGSTFSFYLFGGLLFSGGSLLASNAISDKASASAMMSFINMLSAALAVIIMGYLNINPLQAYWETLIAVWVVTMSLLTFHYARKSNFPVVQEVSNAKS